MKSGIEPLKLVSPPLTQDGMGGPKFTQTMTTQTDYGIGQAGNSNTKAAPGSYQKGKLIVLGIGQLENSKPSYIRIDRQSPTMSKNSSEIKKAMKMPTALERKREKEA